jgi:hypothetical protein
VTYATAAATEAAPAKPATALAAVIEKVIFLYET